jgi:hypothetical protein
MHMEEDMDARGDVDLNSNEGMEKDSYDEEEEDEAEENAEEEDKDAEDGKEKEEDMDEDDDNKCRPIDQGEVVNTSADDVDTMGDDQPIEQSEPGQEMRMHTTWPQHLVHAPGPQTMEPRPRPPTLGTNLLCWPAHLGLVTPQQPRPVVLTQHKLSEPGNHLMWMWISHCSADW